MNENIQPGDIFVTATGGTMGHIIRMATSSKVNHAGIYLGNNLVLEAEPSGAVIRELNNRYPNAVWSHFNLTAAERIDIVKAAKARRGTKYGYGTILVLALVNVFGWTAPNWLIKIMQKTKRMVCSQLADQIYLDANKHIFKDGRIPGLVTPGNLLDRFSGSPNV
jgi:hypothetical protein